VDLATVIGLASALGLIMMAIVVGGNPLMFIDIPSVLIVCGGTTAVVFVRFPISMTLNAMKVTAKAFKVRSESQTELIEKGLEMAAIARRDGLLGLEGVDIQNEFLGKGIQLAVDGHEADFVKKILSKDISQAIERHERGKYIFKVIGDAGPAMGMIGTLVGLVQMMSNMSDPNSIGPAMAVALLTTLYGAVLANAIALPISDKLDYRAKEEKNNKQLILEIVSGIQLGMSPKVLEELLKAYLPGSQRATEEKA
jgi:chemotaxis protein MotA